MRMAATLDWNLVCTSPLDIAAGWKALAFEGDKTAIQAAFCMDNWAWQNLQELPDAARAAECVRAGRIVVLKLASGIFENTGGFLEFDGRRFYYGFWAGLQAFPEADAEELLPQNGPFYKTVFERACALFSQNKEVLLLAVGVESSLRPADTVKRMLESSQNILWGITREGPGALNGVSGYKTQSTKLGSLFFKAGLEPLMETLPERL